MQTETELDELKDVDIYKTTLEKQQIDADKVHNVITTLNALYKKEEWLQTSIEVIDRCINDSEYFVPTCESGEKLYIYKGNISCHQQGHHIESATAILYVKNDREIKINVEYCTECRKFLLNNTLFEKYRKQYGILVGNFYSSSSDSYLFTSSLALESPLHLSGYNVSQADGLTSYERKLILGRIIHNGIMSKWQVSKYLTYFINMNGAKVGNELAVSKWEDDLAFVEKYDMDIQPQVFVSSIAKYKK